MATSWNDTQGPADEISYQEWNAMTTCILRVSGNAIHFSSNAKNLYPGSSNVNRALINSISSNLDGRIDILGEGGGMPSGTRHAIQYWSGTTTHHGGDWHLTYSPLTNRFSLTGGAWIQGHLSSNKVYGNRLYSEIGNTKVLYMDNSMLSGSIEFYYNTSLDKLVVPSIGGGVLGQFPNSSNVRYRFRGSSSQWQFVSSQIIDTNKIYADNIYTSSIWGDNSLGYLTMYSNPFLTTPACQLVSGGSIIYYLPSGLHQASQNGFYVIQKIKNDVIENYAVLTSYISPMGLTHLELGHIDPLYGKPSDVIICNKKSENSSFIRLNSDSGNRYNSDYSHTFTADSNDVLVAKKDSIFVKGAVSSQAISGQWRVPIYNTNRPVATVDNVGKIIRTSGSAGLKTYIWMSVKNAADTYEWIQLGVST